MTYSPKRTVKGDVITMAHGSGGKAMRDLIEDVVLGAFYNPELAALEDQARIDLAELTTQGNRLAMTTDSYVVDPIEFPGGDIGTLAVNGTVNDIAMSGAKPLYLSCGLIIEEGLEIETLRRILGNMRKAADAAGVQIVTGDTKVVNRGKADKLFINTTGVGVIPADAQISASRAKPGDKVIVNGYVGDHGAAILNARGDLMLEVELETDCQPLNGLVDVMRRVCPDIHCMRDASRGGVATVLNEFAESSEVAIRLQESAIPVRNEVRGVCEILGLDPLHFANEGKLVAIVPADKAEALVEAMNNHPAGQGSAIIGEVEEGPKGRVTLQTVLGGGRILDMLIGEQLPRIC